MKDLMPEIEPDLKFICGVIGTFPLMLLSGVALISIPLRENWISTFMIFFIPGLICFLSAKWISVKCTMKQSLILAGSGGTITIISVGLFVLWLFR